MAFKANYGRDRAERARAARARSEEKKRKRDEKTALRKAQRAEVEPPTDETNPPLEEKQAEAQLVAGFQSSVLTQNSMQQRSRVFSHGVAMRRRKFFRVTCIAVR